MMEIPEEAFDSIGLRRIAYADNADASCTNCCCHSTNVILETTPENYCVLIKHGISPKCVFDSSNFVLKDCVNISDMMNLLSVFSLHI